MSVVTPRRATPAATATTAGKPRNVWPIMGGVLLVMLLASLDQTIVGTAMPRVIAQLSGFQRYAWVATAYLLVSTVAVPIYGKLSDLFGRKRIFLLGIVLFLAGSALCGAAQTMTQLIIFRGLQGLGAGALAPVAIAVVGDIFPPKERGKWQGFTGAVWGFAALIGPTLGGWITDNFSWRWIFYVNLPIGLIALAVLTLVMPPLRSNRAGVRIDVLGSVLLAAGVVPLLLALTLAGNAFPWASAQVVGLLILAVVVLSLFIVHETRHDEPILQPRLFTNRIFAVCVLVVLLNGAALLGAVLFVPLFIQGVTGASATGSGAVLTPLMLLAIAGSVTSGQLMSRWGRYRYIALIGLALMMAGVALLLLLGVHTRSADALPGLLLLGAGLGFGMALYSIVVQNAFPRSQLGQVTSAVAFFRAIGGTLGAAVMGSILTSRYTAMLRSALPAHLSARVPAAQLNDLRNPRLLLQPQQQAAIRHTFAHLGPQGIQLYNAILGAVKVALSSALHSVFTVEFLIAAVAFVAVLFLPQIPLRGREGLPDAAEIGAEIADVAPAPLAT